MTALYRQLWALDEHLLPAKEMLRLIMPLLEGKTWKHPPFSVEQQGMWEHCLLRAI